MSDTPAAAPALAPTRASASARALTPPRESELLTLSGTELARLIRGGQLSSRDAIEAHIRRIEVVNPTINAVVRDRFDEARREARDADELLARVGADGVPAFHGVPCTIK
jgi:fatty acid amide hydrolase 2